MSEYSRAPGPGHRATARKRAMQVDRQPSPWPCVAMLAGLLLFCLMAPRYWRNTSSAEVATIGAPSETAGDGTETNRIAAMNFDYLGQPDFSGVLDIANRN